METERSSGSSRGWDISGKTIDGSLDCKANWVRDDCEKGYVYSISRERAEGILQIHAPCEPPCPRKRAASAYLDGDPSSSLD